MELSRTRILIRADGSHKKGMGHIYRQILLAKEFRKFTKEIIFLTKNYKVAKKLLTKSKFKIKTLPKNISEKEEIIYFSKLVDTFSPDTIIVDVLKTKKEYMLSIKRDNNLLITFDNAGYGAYYADVVFNVLYQNFKRKKPRESKARIYLGGKYIIIDPAFSKLDKGIKRKVKNILITQGGSDTYGFTLKILKDLDDKLSNDFDINVVIGPAFKHHKELDNFLNKAKLRYEVFYNVKDMVKLMKETDVAITAGGTTLYQLAAAGIPSMVICGEYFENETANRFHKKGITINLGFGGDIKKNKTVNSLRNLIKNYELRKKMNSLGKKEVDGKGIKRVRDTIISEMKENFVQ